MALVRRKFFIQVDSPSRKRGRPKRTLIEVLVGIDLKSVTYSRIWPG